jgi:elongation factor G
VNFRETIRKPAEGESKWVRDLGGKWEYAHVRIRLEPSPRGSGIELARIDERFFPTEYFPGVEQGLMSALASGGGARYEVTDLLATVTGGSYHDVDSCIHAFAQATEKAVRSALQQTELYLLEPIVRAEISVPEEFAGTTLGEINSHRGRIEDIVWMKGSQTILAAIPEIELAELESALATMGSRVRCSRLATAFDELPRSIAARMRFCPGCERRVLPRGEAATCPDCGSSLDSGADYSAV